MDRWWFNVQNRRKWELQLHITCMPVILVLGSLRTDVEVEQKCRALHVMTEN